LIGTKSLELKGKRGFICMIDAVMKSQNKVFTQKTKKEFSKSKL